MSYGDSMGKCKKQPKRTAALFGNHICLHMMKHGTNSLLWLYTTVALNKEMYHVCITLEGVVRGELIDIYQTQSSFLGEYASAPPLSCVLIVSRDGFFNQNITQQTGYLNVSYVTYSFHVYDSGLLKLFQKARCGLLKSHLIILVQSSSE